MAHVLVSDDWYHDHLAFINIEKQSCGGGCFTDISVQAECLNIIPPRIDILMSECSNHDR